MALQYQIVPNALTADPSYRALVVQDVIDTDQTVSGLALKIPQVSESTIKIVIEELANFTEQMLNEGKSVNIAGFARFFHSIPGRLESANSTVQASSVQVQASISTPVEQRVRTQVSLSRLPFIERVPSMSSILDASGKQNFLGTLLTIRGDGLDFDSNSNSQGVFVSNTHTNTVYRMSTYASVTNTQVIGLNDFISTPIVDQYNEFDIGVRVRYTPNGTLRFGNHRYPSRYTRHVTDDDDVIDNNHIFFTHFEGQDLDSVTVSDISYDNRNVGVYDYRISVKTDLAGVIRPESTLEFTVTSQDNTVKTHTLACYDGEIPVTTFVLDDLALGNREIDDEILSLTLTISNISEFWKAINFSYGGKITEVLQWTVIPPAP